MAKAEKPKPIWKAATLTRDQEDILRRYLAGYKNPIAVDMAIVRGELSTDFDALALVGFAVKTRKCKGWRLSEEGTALARREGILKSGPPHSEMIKGDFIPWAQAVTRLIGEMDNTITPDAAAGKIRRACKNGKLRAQGHGKGKREVERASLDTLILHERNKENAKDTRQ